VRPDPHWANLQGKPLSELFTQSTPLKYNNTYYLRQRRRHMSLPVFVCPPLSKITQKPTHGFGWNVTCWHSTDVGTWMNWLTFELDPDYSPDARTGCFLRYRISAGMQNITSGKSHVYVLARPAAAVTHGFKMVLLTQLSKHFCQRYMHSTECPSSIPTTFKTAKPARINTCLSFYCVISLKLLWQLCLAFTTAGVLC